MVCVKNLGKLGIPGIVLLIYSLVGAPAGANSFCSRIDLPHCELIGSAPTPGPCALRVSRGNGQNCLWDPKGSRWVDVSDNPELRKVLEERNVSAARSPIQQDAPFGRTRIPDLGPETSK